MIHTIAIPRGRLGQLEISQGCIEYQDPETGEWISDANSPGCGAGLPADPGAQQAVQDFASSTTSAANAAALNAASQPASLVLAQSLMNGNVPSPLPGLGITVPNPVKDYLTIAVIALFALFMFSDQTPQRRSR